ncbi:hypothetical protein BOX15_Mlig033333g1 [Macrostomum lignano]|uniref:Uncharacterized protein n=1 Tax=Macrostomum lignano TaxID=282301 RepID=A0A267GLU2_9PLAT|nr:hypothetical protein BOX15_Mlig033333g1 [Macrostomum lignano]
MDQERPASALSTLGRAIGTAAKVVYAYRVQCIMVGIPVALLPLLFRIGTMEAKAGYILVLMSFYWNFEVVPLGVTALFPVVLVPLFGILPSKDICPAYFKDSNMLFLGGLILAVSIEVWDLHKRIALRVLILFGVQPRWLLFGFLIPTWLLSMWISNTATTAMMIPIAEAVLLELRKHFQPSNPKAAATGNSVAVNSGYCHESGDCQLEEVSGAADGGAHAPDPALDLPMKEFLADPRNAEFRGTCKMIMLSVSYGAVFGGVATVTGTSPNVIFNGIVQEYFGSETSFNYSSWMFFAMPVSVLCLGLSWLWLQVSFLGLRSLVRPKKIPKKDEDRIKQGLIKEYQQLGPLSFPEVLVLLLFALTIGLWISREPGVPGWTALFRGTDKRTGRTVSFMSDAQPAIMSAILLFLLPSRNPFAAACGHRPVSRSHASTIHDVAVDEDIRVQLVVDKPDKLMNWSLMQERVAWHIVLMLGSGLALAETSKESGLSEWIGKQLYVLHVIPLEGLVFIFSFCSAILTELTSNGAAATILLPILASFSERLRVHPFYLMLCCTASCSFAFILPISTPANIMVYSGGYLTALDMLRTGSMMTLMSNSIVSIATLSYAPGIFRLYEYPAWASRAAAAALNATAAPNGTSVG